MTEQEQRVAIAEVCGWRDIGMHPHPLNEMDVVLAGRFGAREYVQAIPDFLNDLNAIHNAEEALDCAKSIEFAKVLRQLNSKYNGGHSISLTGFYEVHATAVQRAEAFLRTVGKWKD